MRGIFVLVIVAIIGSSLLGVGHMSGNQDDSYSGWLKTFSKYFDFKKLSGFLNSGGSDDDDDDDCDCEDRKNDHKRHYDDFKKDYDDHKKYYSKGDYKKHLDSFKKYFDDNKHDFDKEDFKQYMDYHKKFLDDNKKYFDSNDYKKYDDDHKKYSNEYPKHDDKCKCDDDHDDECDDKDRKEEHQKYYDDSKKYYSDNKYSFGKGDYKKYLDNFKKYFDYNGKNMDKYDYKAYMDYHKKFLDDNKKYFDSNDYKKYDDDHKKYSNEYPKHDDKTKCDDHDDNVNQSPIKSAKVSFDIEIRELNIKGQPSFQNVLDECVFHSDESFEPLCIKCKFLDDYGKVLATGQVIDFKKKYRASERIPIHMYPISNVYSGYPLPNDVQKVDKVELKICGPVCKCKEHKDDHKRHYDDFKKDYDDHKKYYSKGDYKKHLDNFKKYFDDNKHDFDKEDFKQYMDYHKKFLDDNKKYFDSNDYKKYDDDHKKYSNEYPKHDDKCKCDDDHDDKSAFFVGGGKVYVKNYGSDKFTLTHGFELHCDKTQAPNNLEINWLKNRFHLEELETAECIDDGTPNEPPPSPHPGPTLDVYTGSGYGRYNGVCGAFATWSMDDNGEPGKNDHILSLQIKDKNGNTVLNINNALNLQTGNHQFVPHKSSHPNPPTQTTPCPEVTP